MPDNPPSYFARWREANRAKFNAIKRRSYHRCKQRRQEQKLARKQALSEKLSAWKKLGEQFAATERSTTEPQKTISDE